jgi:hypothetical protein
MPRSGIRTVRAVLHASLAMTTLMLLAACSRSRNLAVPCLPQPGTYAGTLPEPVEQIDAARFRTFVSQKVFRGTRVVDRDCAESDCRPDGQGGPEARIRIQAIEAIEDAHCVDFVNLPANGVVVGRMSNVGSRQDVRYAELPSSTPPGNPNVVWYMVWVPSADGAVLRLVRLTERGPDSPKKEMDPRIGRVFECDKHPSDHPDAGFKKCSPSVAQSAGAPFALPVDRTGTAWLSCAQGCCTAEYSR